MTITNNVLKQWRAQQLEESRIYHKLTKLPLTTIYYKQPSISRRLGLRK